MYYHVSLIHLVKTKRKSWDFLWVLKRKLRELILEIKNDDDCIAILIKFHNISCVMMANKSAEKCVVLYVYVQHFCFAY